MTELNISNDDFIRTTEERHKKVVRDMLQQLFDKGEIYQAEYHGFYCTRQEQFLQEKDRLPDGSWPEIFGEVTEITETNYFFKLRKYQDWLVDFLTDARGLHLPAVSPEAGARVSEGTAERPLHLAAEGAAGVGHPAAVRRELRHLCVVRRAVQLLLGRGGQADSGRRISTSSARTSWCRRTRSTGRSCCTPRDCRRRRRCSCTAGGCRAARKCRRARAMR